MNKFKLSPKLIALASLMISLTFIVTFVTGGIVRTPVPGGYINLGDSIIFLSALLFGPLVGFLAGSIGSSLADIALGSSAYAPGTFLIKGIEGLIAGIIYKQFINKRKEISLVILIIGFLIIITSLYILTGEFNLKKDEIERIYIALSAGVIYSLIGSSSLILNKKDLLIISSMIAGGSEMVIGYYLYERFILGYIAILEVPFNIIQATAGIIVAFLLFKILEKTLKLKI